MSRDLFGMQARVQPLAPGIVLLAGFALPVAAALLSAARTIAAASPFRQMHTRGGHRMSVAMTNCGTAGWITDRSGYRYERLDPLTRLPWPAMPAVFNELAARAAAEAGFGEFTPDACLLNRYTPGARLALHQDRNERDFSAPIVSVSLGLPATFLLGGLERRQRPARLDLRHGDVILWGGPARMIHHGVMPLEEDTHRMLGRERLNLTFRRAL
jgi:DNA oxidative demethylase